MVYDITRACRRGDIKKCQCNSKKRGGGTDDKGDFKWGGCSANVDFGSKIARKYMDTRERRSKDARALMNLHNNQAGRKVTAELYRLSSLT